jgi:hypothetical protein
VQLTRGAWIAIGSGVLAVVALAALFFWLNGGSSGKVASLPALQPLQPAGSFTRLGVVGVNGNAVVVDTGSEQRTLNFGPAVHVDALQPATADAVAAGDYVIVGGKPNLVYPFAVKMIVVIPAAVANVGSNGMPRSSDGFSGWETLTDAGQGPEIYGRVDAVANGVLQASGPLGGFTVSLSDGAPLRKLAVGGIELVHGGDHLALPSGTESNPTAVLDLPGS